MQLLLELTPLFSKTNSSALKLKRFKQQERFMRQRLRISIIGLALQPTILAIALVACSSPPSRQEVAIVTGAVVGGVVGSVVTGGSTLGTTAGAAGGALVGRELARQIPKK